MIPTLAALVLTLQAAGATAPKDLDFWVGTWKVTEEGQVVGTDIVERALNGFAVFEHWKDVEGGEGKSLFHYIPAKKQWRQIWVTPAGGYKEKFSEPYPDGIRFAGTVFAPSGKEYKDRTTLTRMPGGKVHQVIERLTPDGKWQVGFDAIYERQE